MAPEITFLVSSLDASDLRRAGLSIHSARLIKEVPTLGELGTPECSLPWQEELANIERALAASREAVASQDPSIIEGFKHYLGIYLGGPTLL